MNTRLKWNNISILMYQILAVLVGLVLPRLILNEYGSQVNGLVYSISQMLSVVSYFDFGISAVAQAALYGPIKKKNNNQISLIYCAIGKYFRIITYFLLGYVFVLCIYYSVSQNDRYSMVYTSTLVLAISVSTIGQYIWGVSNQVLLAADQKIYLYTFLNCFTTILNALCTFGLVYIHQSIQCVKLVSSLIFLIRPVFLQIYVNKKYNIQKVKSASLNAIEGKWSGLVQHLATTLTSSLDTIVLTLRSTMTNVSIYNVYAFPLNGIRVLVESVSGGYKSYFGNLLVDEDRGKVEKEFAKFELGIHFIGTIFLATATKMLVYFIDIYTRGVNDANYNNKLFAMLMIWAYFIMIIRIPYTTIVNAAGHFKQTQKYSIIEVLINVVISFCAVAKLGLIGITIGTCLAVGYRMLAFVAYLKQSILYRSIRKFVKLICIDLMIYLIFIILTYKIEIKVVNYFYWFAAACLFAICAGIIYFVIFWGLKNIEKFLTEKLK